VVFLVTALGAWDVAPTGGYFAGDHRLGASDLAVCVSSPTADSELRALVDDATEHCPVCQAIRGNVAMQVTAQFDA
jgi:organic hydroperoxide reductase OsmC/OhrA